MAMLVCVDVLQLASRVTCLKYICNVAKLKNNDTSVRPASKLEFHVGLSVA